MHNGQPGRCLYTSCLPGELPVACIQVKRAGRRPATLWLPGSSLGCCRAELTGPALSLLPAQRGWDFRKPALQSQRQRQRQHPDWPEINGSDAGSNTGHDYLMMTQQGSPYTPHV
ncbi:hypothetical protein WJX74_005547 [Apatococcus lobatus]|uniref:Uncharacterized protein n=1 Tax=Apatococcus lobatus TaxID=904363 RepID=A0AAW1QBS8_9CHLO